MRSTIIVRLHEEPKSQAQGLVVRVVLLLEPHGGASVLLFILISDKVHVYSGEGRKTAAHGSVKKHRTCNDNIDQPCSNISWPPCEPVCVFSLLVSLKERQVGHFAVN